MTSIADVIRVLESWFPLPLAAEWDNVGLLLGDGGVQVERIMTCLTVTPEAAAEAIRSQVQLIVSHHPILFRPVKKLTTATSEGRMLLDLVRAGVAVYSPHTSFDNAVGGINDLLATRLGLSQVRSLRTQSVGDDIKLIVFVPDKDLAKVSDAMFEAGAGVIGQYSQCSFRLKGTGTFFGSDASQPTVGEKGRREEVEEWRLEIVCPKAKLEAVVRALRNAHSYEEPAIDLVPLASDPTRGGLGRVGVLAAPITLSELAGRVKASLQAQHVAIVGELDRQVAKVAVACGAAGEFLQDAVRQQADVFLTGEIRFHDALAAQARGISLLVPGHYATERPGVEELATRLALQFRGVEVWASRDERDPLH